MKPTVYLEKLITQILSSTVNASPNPSFNKSSQHQKKRHSMLAIPNFINALQKKKQPREITRKD